MKRIKRIMLLIIIALIVLGVNVYAAETTSKLVITGEDAVKPGETKKITIKLESEQDTVGTISGVIAYSETIEKIEVTGKNSWQLLAYNKDNGKFQLLKAEGAKKEEIIEISYKVKEGASGKAIIELKDINLTTIDYITKTADNVAKEITINEGVTEDPNIKKLVGIEVEKVPNKVKYTEGETFNKKGMIIKAKYSDGTKKEITNYTYTPSGKLKVTDKEITIQYTEGGITKTTKQEITVTKVKDEGDKDKGNNNNNDNEKVESGKTEKEDIKAEKDPTLSDKVLANTGVKSYVVIGLIILVVIGYILYKKVIKYEKI